jgi:hypothetical protein
MGDNCDSLLDTKFNRDVLKATNSNIIIPKLYITLIDKFNKLELILRAKKYFSKRKMLITLKISGWISWFVLNSTLFFYILAVFGLRESIEIQYAWIKSFLIWLILDILFINVFYVIIIHILIPGLLFKKIYKMKKILIEFTDKYIIEKFQKEINLLNGTDENIQIIKNNSKPHRQDSNYITMKERSKFTTKNQFEKINTSNYLFLSQRIAKEFPLLPVSFLLFFLFYLLYL